VEVSSCAKAFDFDWEIEELKCLPGETSLGRWGRMGGRLKYGGGVVNMDKGRQTAQTPTGLLQRVLIYTIIQI